MNKLRTLVFTSLFLLSCATQAEAATLHAIVAANTDCGDIGPGLKVDVQLVHAELNRIAKFTGLQLEETIFSGDQFDSVLVFDYLTALDVKPDDVVIYYHSSHGFRSEGMQAAWPALDFGSKPALDFADIVEVIKAKPQRFAVVLTDCCNNYIPDYAVPPFYRHTVPSIFRRSKVELVNYRHLFLEHQGIVVGAASKPGQYAWINDHFGGFFTMSILEAIKSTCKMKFSLASWDDVVLRASSTTQWLAKDLECSQEPIWQVEVVSIQPTGLSEPRFSE